MDAVNVYISGRPPDPQIKIPNPPPAIAPGLHFYNGKKRIRFAYPCIKAH
jgi:hypothetical protein